MWGSRSSAAGCGRVSMRVCARLRLYLCWSGHHPEDLQAPPPAPPSALTSRIILSVQLHTSIQYGAGNANQSANRRIGDTGGQRERQRGKRALRARTRATRGAYGCTTHAHAHARSLARPRASCVLPSRPSHVCIAARRPRPGHIMALRGEADAPQAHGAAWSAWPRPPRGRLTRPSARLSHTREREKHPHLVLISWAPIAPPSTRRFAPWSGRTHR